MVAPFMMGPVVFLVAMALQDETVAQYRVRITSDLQYAEVAAALPRGTARLVMDSVQAEHLPKGWATFVRDLMVRVDGRPIAVTATDGAAWRLPAGLRAPITLTYRIDLGFARSPWPAGNEQAGAAFDDALYVVGRALFIVGDRSARIHITFDLPAGWRASARWRSTGSASRAFQVADFTELTRNALVLGRHVSTRVRSGPFELELALPGQPPAVAAIVEPALRRVLDAYLDLFPGTPPTQYLMTFFRAGGDDGESFTHSASFTTSDSVTTAGLIVWGNFLAHELMHFWNGQRIRGAGPRTTWRWLAEGFTEYYANVTLARQGIIATDLFLRRAERHIGNYLYFATAPALARMSLVEAGSNTGRNRFGVYDGGWIVAFCLDGLIREASGDKRSLDDFMRELWRRFSGDRSGYTVAGLDSLANQLAGVDLGGIIRQYVETQSPLPVAQCLDRVGLAAATKGYAAEAFLFPAPNATPAEVARGGALFHPVVRFDSLLVPLRYELRVEDGTLVGPGAELLRSALEGVQFVALGEEHNTRAIPHLSAALFRMAHDGFGFDYLALEEGPSLGVLLSTASRAGGPDSVLALGRRYPNAFHMYTEDELDMIGEIGHRSTGATAPLWGLNQEFGAAHAYARLVAIAPDAGARVLAQELLADALSYEGERFGQNVHYLVEIARPADFERLRDAFRPARGSEADGLIGQLALSNEIYGPYRAGRAPPAGAFHESGRARETNMKRLFTERYRNATAGGARLPKVLVKSGHLHLYRGLSPRTELYTLGNFLSELAIFNGFESLHIYAVVDRPHVRDGWLAPFARAAHPGEATVFDLRPLAAWARRERTLDPNLRRLLLGYDALVFLRDGSAGSLEGLRTPRFRWYQEPD